MSIVITETKKRRQRRAFSDEFKAEAVKLVLEGGKHGLAASQLFRWRQHRDAGSLTGLKVGAPVVAESELQALKAQVRQLQRILGKKTQEAEILRDAIELAREKKLLSPAALSKLDDIL